MSYLMVYNTSLSETDVTESRVMLRKSTDGLTWGDAVQIYSLAPTYALLAPCLCQLADGRVLLTVEKEQWPVWSTIAYGFSSDGGTTWTSPLVHLPTSVGPDADGPWISNGAKQLVDGSIIVSWYSTSPSTAMSIRSEDNCATWIEEATIATGVGKLFVEPDIIQLADTSLLCLIREMANTEIWYSTSADMGVTWAAAAYAFDGGGAPRMRMLSSGKIVVNYRSADGTDRTAYRTSDDDGATWSAEVVPLLDGHTGNYGMFVELAGNKTGHAYSPRWNTAESAIHYAVIPFASLP